MAFVDEARIFVKAGDGGKGCESFCSDRFTRYPRPDGGDGGKGGDIVFIADKRIQTLLDYRFKQHYKGKKGGHASSRGKNGRNAEACVLRVPLGTIIREQKSGNVIKDLTTDGQEVIVARGGRGGTGNARHKKLHAPQAGEEKTVFLELKIIADVGLVGFPNAGKSTLISSVSSVRPKIASYPFTTRQPVLGIVKADDFDFIIADLPGLIEGAHKGKGLGDKFLKHIERTRILVHVVDMGASEGRDPLKDYEQIKEELHEYSNRVWLKKRIVVANKMDLPDASLNLKRFKKKHKEPVVAVSALKKTGLEPLVKTIIKILCRENSKDR